jgi:hypothetical protein
MVFKDLGPLMMLTVRTFRENFARNSHAENIKTAHGVRGGVEGPDCSEPFRLRHVAGPEPVDHRLGHAVDSVRATPTHPR